MTRTAVLGGGALGLTAALRLAQRGEEVVLYERESQPGGLAAGFQVGPSYLEKFYHHLFRSDTSAISLIEELGLGDKLTWPRPKTSTLLGGRLYQLDSPSTLLRFDPLSPPERLRLGAALAYLKLEPNYRRLESTTAAAWLPKWMGPRAYELIWRPLLESKFGERYDEVVMSWFWARVRYRSTSLGYLRGGFQQLYNGLVERIEQLGGTVCLGHDVKQIRSVDHGTLEVETSSGMQRFGRVVSTLPTRLTINLTPQLAGDYAEQYSHLDSLGAQCLILALDRPLTDVYWMNVNDPGFPFMVAVEHTNYMPPADYGGRHIVYLGNYLPLGDRLMKLTQAELLEQFLPALQRINPALRPEWVTESWLFRAPFAQPIMTLGYRERLPAHTTPIANLFLANMSQVYPQDRGQNYSIAMANRLVDSIPLGT